MHILRANRVMNGATRGIRGGNLEESLALVATGGVDGMRQGNVAGRNAMTKRRAWRGLITK